MNPVDHPATARAARLTPAVVDRLRDLHTPITLPDHHARMRPDYPGVCRTCWDSKHGGFAAWPCPTAQVLGLDGPPTSPDADPDSAPTGREDIYEAMAEQWLVFKDHAPAGAYLPVGQLDGDCSHRECGGDWPCTAIRSVFDPLLDVIAADQTSLRTQVAALAQSLTHAVHDVRLARNLLDASDLSRRRLVRERDLVKQAISSVLLRDDIETVRELKRALSVVVGDARIAARSATTPSE